MMDKKESHISLTSPILVIGDIHGQLECIL